MQDFGKPDGDTEGLTGDVRKAVSLGFYYPTRRLVGVPEREEKLFLENTGEHPYQLFASDSQFHSPGDRSALYASVPYVTSVAENHAAGVAWLNSANTFVSVSDMEAGKYVNFVSESGALELFAFSSASLENRFKKV